MFFYLESQFWHFYSLLVGEWIGLNSHLIRQLGLAGWVFLEVLFGSLVFLEVLPMDLELCNIKLVRGPFNFMYGQGSGRGLARRGHNFSCSDNHRASLQPISAQSKLFKRYKNKEMGSVTFGPFLARLLARLETRASPSASRQAPLVHKDHLPREHRTH